MRYLYVLAVLFLAPTVYAQYNESVAAISYNPSRLGAYSHLKVVKEAVFSGLDATNADVNVMSKGTVILRSLCSGNACPATQTITKILPMPEVSDCNNSDFCGVNTTANYGTKLEATANAVIGANVPSDELEDLTKIITADAFNQTFPEIASDTTITVQGGTLTHNEQGNAFVKSLSAKLEKLTLNVNELIMNGTNTSINAKESVKLGGVSVGSPGSRTLVWDDRVDTGGKKAKVLTAK